MTAKLKDLLHGTLGNPIRKAGATGGKTKTATSRNAINGLKLDYLLNGLYLQTLGNSLIDLVSPLHSTRVPLHYKFTSNTRYTVFSA